MARLDKTGPLGMGPMTGRKMGRCKIDFTIERPKLMSDVFSRNLSMADEMRLIELEEEYKELLNKDIQDTKTKRRMAEIEAKFRELQ